MELKKKRSFCGYDLRSLMTNEGVELGHFAARIVKIPIWPEAAKPPELAAQVGIDVKPLSGRSL